MQPALPSRQISQQRTVLENREQFAALHIMTRGNWKDLNLFQLLEPGPREMTLLAPSTLSSHLPSHALV